MVKIFQTSKRRNTCDSIDNQRHLLSKFRTDSFFIDHRIHKCAANLFSFPIIGRLVPVSTKHLTVNLFFIQIDFSFSPRRIVSPIEGLPAADPSVELASYPDALSLVYVCVFVGLHSCVLTIYSVSTIVNLGSVCKV